MSREGSEYTARLLTGKESMIDGVGNVDMFAVMYLELLAANADFEQEVRQIVVEHFERRFQKCLRAITSPLLDMLRNRKVVHAISNHMHFIAVSCPARGIHFQEFTSLDELRRLWRDAHLRSAREVVHSEGILHERPGDMIVIASAVLAGITAEEIGISQSDADSTVDSYFQRNNPDPKMKAIWEAHQADYDQMKKLFAIS